MPQHCGVPFCCRPFTRIDACIRLVRAPGNFVHRCAYAWTLTFLFAALHSMLQVAVMDYKDGKWPDTFQAANFIIAVAVQAPELLVPWL